MEQVRLAERGQRRRDAGWKAPKNSVYVGRPTKWGNPFTTIPNHRTRDQCIALYRRYAEATFTTEEVGQQLAGKILLCWCDPEEPCHADVLVEMANRTGVPTREHAAS